MIILCGFNPADFASKSFKHSESFYGQIRVAEHSTFSQITKVDSHHRFRDAMRTFNADICDVPVAQSLNLAFGMIRVKGRHTRTWVIPCEWGPWVNVDNSKPKPSSWDVWGVYASARQLQNIKYSFQRFVGTEELEAADYCQGNDAFETDDVRVLKDLTCSSGLIEIMQLSDDAPRTRARVFLNATHAIAAIQPWALLPVLPGHVVNALKIILDPFYKTREFTISILKRELSSIADKTLRPEGRTGKEISQRLDSIVGSKDAFFGASNHGFHVSLYHEAMSMVFQHRKIKLKDVRISLAAAVVSELIRLQYGAQEEATKFEHFRESTKQYLERCYMQAKTRQKLRNVRVPSWAVDVYGSYLWGWVTGSKPADPDLISYFRRRVFLA